MRWYDPVECDNTLNNPLVCDYNNLEDFGFNELDFLYGKTIVNWPENIVFQAKKKKNDGDPDDVLQNADMLPIFSPRLIETLKKEQISGVQYLPIKVLRPNNEVLDGFSLINFLNFIDALNYDKSEYDRFSDDFPNPNIRGKIAGVKKFVLYKTKLIGKDIIRLKDYKRSFFVSEKIKKIFEKNHFTGYSFRSVELSD